MCIKQTTVFESKFCEIVSSGENAYLLSYKIKLLAGPDGAKLPDIGIFFDCKDNSIVRMSLGTKGEKSRVKMIKCRPRVRLTLNNIVRDYAR
jgi:hypothetical protein